MISISVIIPTYNGANSIGVTLNSLIMQDYPADCYEIIVADNNSTDDTKSVIESFMNNARQVKVMYFLEVRQGAHYARNSAAKMAQYQLLYYTDDDIIAKQNMLSEIIKPFRFDRAVGTATGRVLPKWEINPPRWIVKHCNNSLLSLLDPPEEFVISREAEMLYSCHQAVRKDVLLQAGGFNPDITKGVWLGDGETGLNRKIRDLGYKFAFNGASIVYHVIPASRMTQSYLNYRIGNSGYVHAFSSYAASQPTRFQLIAKVFIRTFIDVPKKILFYLYKALRYKDWNYGRFILAYFYYYFNWLRYDYRLITCRQWREMVLCKDWISDDAPDVGLLLKRYKGV